MTLGAQTEVILLANSIGLVNESRGEYGTNGINGFSDTCRESHKILW
jgi:hypothetical protein